MDVKDLEYPNSERMLTLLKEADGIEIISEEKDYIEVWDNYADNDRFIRFNRLETLQPLKLVETFGNNIDNLYLNKLFKKIPLVMFMNIQKIFFVNSEEDRSKLDDVSPNHTFQMEHLGMHVYHDGTIIINLKAHMECAKEEAAYDENVLGYGNIEEHYVRAVWMTIVHELFHSLQENPLFETVVPVGEEEAEEFCRDFMEQI